jgi:hypothetical protein
METNTGAFKKILTPIILALMGMALIGGCGGGSTEPTGLEEFGLEASDLRDLEEGFRGMSAQELRDIEDAAHAYVMGE